MQVYVLYLFYVTSFKYLYVLLHTYKTLKHSPQNLSNSTSGNRYRPIVIFFRLFEQSAGDHAIFGIIVLVLAIIQPTVAFFRPHPNEPRLVFFERKS